MRIALNLTLISNRVNILEIYKKYQIMPQLMEHQLTVAAVAEMICEHFTPLPNPPRKGEGIIRINRDDIVAACLLHDMGNIVKFDLNQTAELYPAVFAKPPEDQIFWENVKQEFIKKYGTGSHNATVKIVAELGVNQRIRELVDCVGFDQGPDNAQSPDFGKKICQYADDRVGPKGIISLEERFADLRKRYEHHKNDTQERDNFENSLRQIERQIFEHCKIKSSDITEAEVVERKEKLKNFDI